jgi:hypothetical protein
MSRKGKAMLGEKKKVCNIKQKESSTNAATLRDQSVKHATEDCLICVIVERKRSTVRCGLHRVGPRPCVELAPVLVTTMMSIR